MKQTIIIGDAHACLEELKELLDLINYDPSAMRLVFLGDLLDRGPYSVECLKFVRELNVECVKGNHEDFYTRYYKHEQIKKETGKLNPMKYSKYKMDIYNRLSEEDICWMEKLPVVLHLKDNWYAIHGGLESNKYLENQNPAVVMRCRYVNEKGKMVSLNKDNTRPAGTVYWTDAWNGKESIVYGHMVHSLTTPLIDKGRNGTTMIGIDNGCCFGGRLTAFILEENRFVQVNAKKEYTKIVLEE